VSTNKRPEGLGHDARSHAGSYQVRQEERVPNLIPKGGGRRGVREQVRVANLVTTRVDQVRHEMRVPNLTSEVGGREVSEGVREQVRVPSLSE
jgi:hypothetical protein